jgi:hypothetical protein
MRLLYYSREEKEEEEAVEFLITILVKPCFMTFTARVFWFYLKLDFAGKSLVKQKYWD